jgi:FkbM family methyltransferase
MGWRDGKLVTITASFGVLRAYESDVITKNIQNFGAHNRPELAFLCNMIEPGDRVFDLGAHIGTFTIPMAQRVGATGLVVAVEAVAESFALLAENISANGLADRIRPIQAVIAQGSFNYAPQFVDINSGATHFVRTEDTAGAVSLSIDGIAAMTVTPDLIKIDIEGLELDALQSSKTIRAHRPVIYAEVSLNHLARYGATIDDFDRFLRSLDYRMFRNIGERNGAHDNFIPSELKELSECGRFCDVLAIARDSARLERIAFGGS